MRLDSWWSNQSVPKNRSNRIFNNSAGKKFDLFSSVRHGKLNFMSKIFEMPFHYSHKMYLNFFKFHCLWLCSCCLSPYRQSHFWLLTEEAPYLHLGNIFPPTHTPRRVAAAHWKLTNVTARLYYIIYNNIMFLQFFLHIIYIIFIFNIWK